jgi:hypothetical protein
LELEGINPLMFRKTLAAWLVVCFPEKMEQVVTSMGCGVAMLRELRKERKFEREDMEKARMVLKWWGE